jgi:hypothetical protein
VAPPPVEFLDADGPEPPPAGGPGSPPARGPAPRRRTGLLVLLAAAAVFALVGGLLRHSNGRPEPSTPAASPTVGHAVASPHPVPGPVNRIVYLSGCNGCVRAPEVPRSVVLVLLATFRTPLVQRAYSVISNVDGRLFSRGVGGRADGGRFDVEITIPTDDPNGVIVSRAAGGRRTVTVLADGYRISVRTTGVRIPLPRLLELATDPALVDPG